jgi:hypothetical protein
VKHLWALLLLALICGVARADGGHVRLQQTSGELTIALFTAPEPLVTGSADFSVLVQDRSTQQLLPDADIVLELRPPAGDAKIFHLSKSVGGNRMFQSATVSLPAAGNWSANLTVKSGNSQELISTTFPVAENHSRRYIVIAMMILPVVIILLAFLHRYLRRKQAARSAATSRPA